MPESCRHPQLKIVYVSNDEGSVELEICKNCSNILTTTCEHTKNTWVYTRNEANPEEQKLICQLCGAEGT